VPFEEYENVCDEVESVISGLKDARTGKPLVEKIIRTRSRLEDETSRSPDADLVVVWQEETVADAADTGGFGRIGPVPFIRTGSHRAQGFFSAVGSDLVAGNRLAQGQGHALDLGPTFLELMGGDASEMEGRNLFQKFPS
jgi:hypothetical protein